MGVPRHAPRHHPLSPSKRVMNAKAPAEEEDAGKLQLGPGALSRRFPGNGTA